MPDPTNAELVARWKDEPAPLLPLLHAFHERDGHLSEEALRAVAKGLRIPIADLFGTVTFYHHFAREPGGLERPRVCNGPVCSMRGAEVLVASLRAAGHDPHLMPCPGRCDQPVPVIHGGTVLTGRTAGSLVSGPSPLPPPAPDGVAECVFAGIRNPGRATLAGYRSEGGYEALARAVTGMTPGQVIDVIDASGLAGRGGAGFPTGRKWRAVADAPGGPKTVVCNADEGEPGCFKDRVLMDHDPHATIEGLALAAYRDGGDARLRLPALRVPGDVRHPRGRDCRGGGGGAAGRRDPGHGLRVRPDGAARRGRVHLRRRDVAAQFARGRAPLPPQPPPLSGSRTATRTCPRS